MTKNGRPNAHLHPFVRRFTAASSLVRTRVGRFYGQHQEYERRIILRVETSLRNSWPKSGLDPEGIANGSRGFDR